MDNVVPMVPSTPPPLDDSPDDDDEWPKDDFGSFVTPSSTFPKDDGSNWADFSSPPKSKTTKENTETNKEPEPLRFKAPSVSEEECDSTDDVVYSTSAFDAVEEETVTFPKSSSNSSLGSEVRVNAGKLLTDEEILEEKESNTPEPNENSQISNVEASNDVQKDSIPERENEVPIENFKEKLSGEKIHSQAEDEPSLIIKETKIDESELSKTSSPTIGDENKCSATPSDLIENTDNTGKTVVEKTHTIENDDFGEFAEFQSTNVVNNVLEQPISDPSSNAEVKRNEEGMNFADFQSSTAETSNDDNITSDRHDDIESKDTKFETFQNDEPNLNQDVTPSTEIDDENNRESEDDFANFQSSVDITVKENDVTEGDDFADFQQFQSDEDNFANFQSSAQSEDDDWAFQGSEQSTSIQVNQESSFAAFKDSNESPVDLSKVEVKSLLDKCFKKEWLPAKTEKPLEILQYAKEHFTKTEEQNKSPSELRVTPLTGQTSAKNSKREIDISFWNNLTHLEETLALQYSWTKSGVYQFLLKAINVDTRNILTGNKNLPIFASHLGTPLEPMRQGETKVITPSLEIVDTSNSSAITPSDNVPPAQFDWSTSGLKNPLDSRVLDLDFFQDDLDETSVSSVSAMEDEILDSIEPEVKKNQKLQPLEEILSLKNFRSTAPTVHRTDNLSSSAKSVVTRIPDISFMRSHMLMFPLKTAHSN